MCAWLGSFLVDLEGNTLWEVFLSSRERTEYSLLSRTETSLYSLHEAEVGRGLPIKGPPASIKGPPALAKQHRNSIFAPRARNPSGSRRCDDPR